ncbi:MAG: hypothetical protein EOO40_00470 [Deltaproteobacteria bacterium]|nr:MAG: hypothetical protein EOO40_00470 [Deltaproteobacteria bacterium]
MPMVAAHGKAGRMSKAFTSDDAPVWLPTPALPEGERPVTPDGREQHQDNLRSLLEGQRPQLMARLAAGDTSAAAQLHEVDRRAAVLARLLQLSQSVPPPPGPAEKAFFGAWVTVRDDDTHTTTYRIVGPDQIDLKRRWVSHQSPLGAALLGQALGTYVTVQRPRGDLDLQIIAVSATSPCDATGEPS